MLCEDADQEDPLGLGGPVREQLRAAGDVTHMDSMQVMYMDSTTDEIPGALAPKLLYSVSGNDVSVRIRLAQDGKTVAEQKLRRQPEATFRGWRRRLLRLSSRWRWALSRKL